MLEPILEISDLDAFYGDFQALFGLNITVFEGEVLAIIGSNGAGKSTLMHSIAGLLANRHGQINFRGQSIGNLRADKVVNLGITLVPEGRQLFPSLSVEENLLIGGRSGRIGYWSLETVYKLFPILAERRNQDSLSLSGGQQQMVAIGRALMANPDVILFDEISLGLAPIVIKDIYNAFPSIIDKGLSAVIVEQDISKALSVSSRFYCLQEGRVSLEGNSSDATHEEISQAYFGMS